MYTSFFGFKENPFNLTPDPRYLFLSRYHKEALDHLLYGINERKGFIAITGGIGTGKTTLCRAFLSHLDTSTKSALIFNSFISDSELLKSVNQEFGIEMDPAAESKKEYIDALNHFLLENFSKGGNSVLLVDEAQNLSHSVLEQIRMLSNLETEREKLIQIILVGQPELRELLLAPSLRQLDERITVRYDLKPLDSGDIKGYVEHRLVVAGNRGDLKFTNGALKKVFAYSKGNPRRINAVCDRALLIAYAVEKRTVSERMLAKAIEEVRGDVVVDPRTKNIYGKRFGLAAFCVILLIVAAVFGGWHFKNDIRKQPAPVEKTTVTKIIRIPRKPVEPPKKASSLFLDKKGSLAALFRLFNEKRSVGSIFSKGEHLELVSLTIGPEYHVMFKKPFLVRLSGTMPPPRYLLVGKLTQVGATVVDADGREHPVARDFILKNWGSKISWFYPYKNRGDNLKKGVNSSEVLEVQKVLYKTGYSVEPTGVFDESMVQEVIKFQKDFGLMADGIIGPQTMAVLYLMS